jgi:hypothetical protein
MTETTNGHNRTEINRANAEHSTGPRTPEGKARSSQNALRHGLTARATLLPTEDPAVYQRHSQKFLDEYHPQGATEHELVHSLAESSWLRSRVTRLEEALFSPATNTEDDPRTIESQSRALTSFSMHRHRLSRQFESTLNQLREVQEKRRATEAEQLDKAAELLQMDQEKEVDFHPAEDGFVFSVDEIETFIHRRHRAQAASNAAYQRRHR